jgi:hypothetical protein
MEKKAKRLLAVYTVISKGEGKDVWLRVGSAFENRDGSTSVLLDALPVGGRLQIREYQPRELGQPREESRMEQGTLAATKVA